MPKIDNLIPVLIGADMNCYTVARAFHEEYGVPSYAFGRWSMGDTMYSKIVHFTEVPNIDEKSVLVDTLNKFAIEHKGCKLVVLGCTDDYASMLIDCKAELESQY
ncbi:MAG: ATP-grasp domain-containing protein, partial [Oscillospiraceae bacterium]